MTPDLMTIFHQGAMMSHCNPVLCDGCPVPGGCGERCSREKNRVRPSAEHFEPTTFAWLCRKIAEMALAYQDARDVRDPVAHAYWARRYHEVADEIEQRIGIDPRPEA